MKINKNPTLKDIRQFMLMWMVFVSFFGGIALWRHHNSFAHGAWWLALGLGVPGLLIPPLGRAVYRTWMTLAFCINYVVTRALLTLVYWGILTPIALMFKLMGRDVLWLRKPKGQGSYWQAHPKITDPSYYGHLY